MKRQYKIAAVQLVIAATLWSICHALAWQPSIFAHAGAFVIGFTAFVFTAAALVSTFAGEEYNR